MKVRCTMVGLAMIAVNAFPASVSATEPDTAPGPLVLAMPGAGKEPKQHDTMFDRTWFAKEWLDYKRRFVAEDGRVIDNANGNVSHSEGQGYGLLLSASAGDADTFASIWSWTKQNLYVREDGLASWKWDPARHAVADSNNATDGDILIAWALDRGATRFDRPDYREAAQRIAQAIGHTVVLQGPSGPLLLPGAVGFTAPSQADGPVINLSYYVFPAFARLKALAPEVDWDGVNATGLSLLRASSFGPLHLPTDWVALGHGAPRPAASFPPLFGYDAIRIPLYLAWAGRVDDERQHRFSSLWSERENIGPFVIEIATGSVRQNLEGTGYRLIAALAACSVKAIAIPDELLRHRDNLYYPETLRLLAYVAAKERHPQCL
ncbi:MAG: glycosyl hydrolase family 8 [Janthinobacterium lividum]